MNKKKLSGPPLWAEVHQSISIPPGENNCSFTSNRKWGKAETERKKEKDLNKIYELSRVMGITSIWH
jgi:hypothetical protein